MQVNRLPPAMKRPSFRPAAHPARAPETANRVARGDAFETAPARQMPSLHFAAPQTVARTSLATATPPESATDGELVGAGNRVYPPTTPLGEIAPVLPNNGKTPTGETVVYVNGVGSHLKDSMAEAQAIANATGEGVINLHNATDGNLGDLFQSVGDYFGVGKNKAVDSLTGLIYQHLKDGEPLHLVGHSQGTMIISRALTNAKLLLEKDGRSQAQAEAAMHALKVETFAGAAPSYPDGPQYVHYMDDADPVARLGLDHPFTHPGKGAVIERYDTGFDWLHPLRAHDIGLYLKHWVPFDQARGGASQAA